MQKHWIRALCPLLLSALFLCGCTAGEGTGHGERTESSTEEVTTMEDVTADETEMTEFTLGAGYAVVYPARNSAAIDVAAAVQSGFSDLALPLKSDGEAAGDLEVLVGNTNRPETARARDLLGDGDVIVCAVGKKLVIYATADAHYAAALEYLAAEFFGRGDVTVPADLCVTDTVDTVRTFAVEERVGAGLTTVDVILRAKKGAAAGLFVGDDLRGQGILGYRGYCLAADADTLTLYAAEAEFSVLASRRIQKLREGTAFRLRLEIGGGYLRCYLLDDAEGVEPWPEIEVPCGDLTGQRVGFAELFGDGCVYEGLSVSYGDAPPTASYTNSVYNGYADPDVLYHEGTYYLYATGGAGGYRVHTSTDLIHWRDAGVCAAYGMFGITKNYWAPDVEEINGRFYMVTSCNETLGLAVSDSPLGPFTAMTAEPLYRKSIDGHLFVDDDGRVYLYFVSWRSTYGIYGVELDGTMAPIASTERLLILPTEPWERDRGNVTEGPYLLKHEGLYYLTYSGSHYESERYAVGYATADSPLGQYEKYALNPIMVGNAFVHGTGHHCIVTKPDGEMWIVYHAHKSLSQIHARRVCIDRIRFAPAPSGPDRLEVYGPTVGAGEAP